MKKPKKYPIEILTVPEIRLLLKSCSNCDTGVRNKALIAVLWRGGLRCAEALALEEKDICDGVVRIRHGKGDTTRTVALDPEATAVLGVWLERRARLGLTGPLFCSLNSTPLLPSYCRTLLTRLGKKAKIAKRVHPHGLRHTFASGLADEKVDLRIVQHALGHRNLNTTMTYIDHLQPTAVIDALKARTW